MVISFNNKHPVVLIDYLAVHHNATNKWKYWHVLGMIAYSDDG